jgi:hypothetical protein
LAEVVFGRKPAHASNCKAAAKSEDDFFMNGVFPGSDAGGYFKFVLKVAVNILDVPFGSSIRPLVRA